MSEHVFWPPEPFASADLLHLLTCSTCRTWMIGRLLEQGAQDEETLVEEYGELWGRLREKLPEHIEEGRARRETAGRTPGTPGTPRTHTGAVLVVLGVPGVLPPLSRCGVGGRG